MQKCDLWLDRHYGKIDRQEFSLLDRSARTLLSNILQPDHGKTLPWRPYRGIAPSHIGFRGIWNWDAAFHAMGVAYWDIELAREQILMFLSFQLDNGSLPDVVFEDGRIVDDFGKPPVMPWAAMLVDNRAPSLEFAQRVYPAFVKHEKFWMEKRGGIANGLFNYDSSNPDEKERFNRARCESGWDNSVRWDSGIFGLWPIDLNCYMVMLYRAMAYFAKRLGRNEELAKWRERELAMASLVERELWSEKDNAYLDYDFVHGKFISALSPASFMPLYAGIASREHAAAMAKIGGDPHKFRPGWPTVSYDNPAFDPEGYWRGRTWLNAAYFALKGLKDYGYDEIADEGKETLLKWVAGNPDFIYENYHPITGKGLGVRNAISAGARHSS